MRPFGEVVRRGNHELRSAQHAASEPRRAAGQLRTVRAPTCTTYRLTAPCSDPARGKPVRVEEVGVEAARSANETGEEWRYEQRQTRGGAEDADHAMTVGDPEVWELLPRPDDLDLDAAGANVLHRVWRRTVPQRRPDTGGYDVVRTATRTGRLLLRPTARLRGSRRVPPPGRGERGPRRALLRSSRAMDTRSFPQPSCAVSTTPADR